MSVWISDEKLLIFASLISPSKMIRHRQDLEVRQKYSAVRRIFNSLLGVSSGDETLHLMFDILLENEQLLTKNTLIHNEMRLDRNPTRQLIMSSLLTGYFQVPKPFL